MANNTEELIKQGFAAILKELQKNREEIEVLRQELAASREEIAALKQEIEALKQKITEQDDKFRMIHHAILSADRFEPPARQAPSRGSLLADIAAAIDSAGRPAPTMAELQRGFEANEPPVPERPNTLAEAMKRAEEEPASLEKTLAASEELGRKLYTRPDPWKAGGIVRS